MQVPAGLTRLVEVAGGEVYTFVLLEDVIRNHLSQLFPGQTIVETDGIRLARDAELEFDDEGGRTHLEMVERELRQRRTKAVRTVKQNRRDVEKQVKLARREADKQAETIVSRVASLA